MTADDKCSSIMPVYTSRDRELYNQYTMETHLDGLFFCRSGTNELVSHKVIDYLVSSSCQWLREQA